MLVDNNGNVFFNAPSTRSINWRIANSNKMKLDSSGNFDVIGGFTSGTIQADNGFTGDCVNASFVSGIATGCND